jgi:hypothetical protein
VLAYNTPRVDFVGEVIAASRQAILIIQTDKLTLRQRNVDVLRIVELNPAGV